MEEVESFDLFDTILTRGFILPQDMFYFLGLRLYEDKILPMKASEFKKARIKAEEIARKQSKFEEVTIDEIYEALKTISRLSDEIVQEIKRKELEFELLESTPIAENVEKIGPNSVIISDTYLPKSLILSLLTKNQINTYRDVYVSSETKCTKSSGKMFEYVMQKYKIRKHIGDNPHSDFRIPKELGIFSELYKNSKPTRYEKLVYYAKDVPYEIRALVAGSMRATRLALFYEGFAERKLHEITSNVIAPFLNLYCLWVLENAQKFGLEKLYFLTRDGKILQETSKILKRLYQDFDIELHYLPCSRRSLFIPAISEDFMEPLKWILDGTKSRGYFCKIFELNPEHIDLKFLSFNDIVNNQKILEHVLEKAKEKRKILAKYLKQEGFNKNSKIGVVDVGWRGRLQAAISRVLKMADLYNDEYGIKGFYIGLVDPVDDQFSDKKLVFLTKKYLYHAELIERFTAADHGSCIGYRCERGKVYPVFEDIEYNEEIKMIQLQHKSIKFFAEKFSEALLRYKIEPSLVNKYGRKICGIILYKFIYFPEKFEAKVFGRYEHSPDIVHSEYKKLCRKLTGKETIYLNIPKKIRNILGLKNISDDPFWIEGSNVLTLPIYIAYFLNYLHFLYHIIKLEFLSTLTSFLRRTFY